MLDFRNLRVVIFTFFISLLLYLPAYSQEPPFAYITDFFGTDNVCVVNLLTNTEVEVIDVCDGCEPYWIAASADQNLVAASLHDSAGVALIDPETMSHIGNVAGVGSEPEAVAVNSTGTLVYVADESGDDLFVVDVATQTVVGVPINLDPSPPDCSEPENMVISPDDSTLYITCAGSSVISVNTTTFAITQIATGLSDPHGIVLNPAGTRLYYTNGTDVIQYNTVTDVNTGITYLGCDMQNGALSPDGARLYCVEENDDLYIYSIAGGAAITVIDLGSSTAWGVAVSPDNARAFVPFGDVLKVVDTSNFNVTEIALTCTDARDIVIVQEIPPPPLAMVPTISEWGLIAMAGILGIVGFMVMRRRKAVA